MENSKERKIKITPKYFPRVWKDVVFPEIRLAGKWLQDAGFICGEFVTITQHGNSILITALPAAEVVPPVKKYKRKKDSFMSPDLENVPINQLFRQWSAEDFFEYMDKVHQKKKKKMSLSKLKAWEEHKNESKTRVAKKPSKKPEKADRTIQIAELDTNLRQVAERSRRPIHAILGKTKKPLP